VKSIPARICDGNTRAAGLAELKKHFSTIERGEILCAHRNAAKLSFAASTKIEAASREIGDSADIVAAKSSSRNRCIENLFLHH
jgi:hypothetical protein